MKAVLPLPHGRTSKAWAERIAELPGYNAPYDLLPMEDKEIG